LEKLDLYIILFTPIATIIGGIIIFVTGQIILKFVIDPILELNRLRGEIAHSLIYYANIYSNTSPIYTDLTEDARFRNEVQENFRKLGSQLCPKASIIPWFNIWELLRIVPKFQDVMEATSQLIGLSNSVHDVNVNFNRSRREKIQTLLKIKV